MPNTATLNLPYPTGADTANVPRDIQALAEAIDPLGTVPIGAMMMWPAASAPSGWLLCNGQQVSADEYPGLAGLLGQIGGQVTMPDLVGRFPMMASSATPLGSSGGADQVGLSIGHMPTHSHGGSTDYNDRSLAHAHSIQGTIVQPRQGGMIGNHFNSYEPIGGVTAVDGWAGATAYNWGIGIGSDPAPDHLHAIGAEGNGFSHENRPSFRAVNFIIRAG